MEKAENRILSFFSRILKRNKPEYTVDHSRMPEHRSRSKVHFLYALLCGIGMTSALWQHGTFGFTVFIQSAVILLSFAVFIPFRFAGILLRQMVSCVLFFCSCLWVGYRLKNAAPFDLALVEGLIAGTLVFLINCTPKNYSYLLFSSLFILIYSGLIPRKLLLFLIPGAVFCVICILLAERKESISGTDTLLLPSGYSRKYNGLRSWHFLLIQLLLALPVFFFVFSLMPLYDTGNEGLFEVSFMTGRRSVMPPDLKKWLKQDRKAAKDKDGDALVSEGKPDTVEKSGRKMDIPDVPAVDFGSGRGSPPGKDLLFTVSMPVKLYHLATLYDVYDGKKWMTSTALSRSRNRELSKSSGIMSFVVNTKYTIVKWFAPRMYAPFRIQSMQMIYPDDEQMVSRFFYRFKQNFFSAYFADPDRLPPLPFRYDAVSTIAIPLLRKDPGKNDPQQGLLPEVYSSAGEFFAQQLEKEKARLLRIRQAEEARAKRLEAQKAAREKKLKAARERARRKAAQEAKARAKRLNAKKKSAVKKTALQSKPVKKVVKKTLKSKVTVFKTAIKKKTLKQVPVRKNVKKRAAVKRDPAWVSSLPESHFCQLPEQLSPRIAKLAENITRNCITPYEKAIALRDYLRNNYKYRLYGNKIPDGVESVEYFLFEAREGHCEFFAAALTVLARTLKLPARVATGFSPGNYNTLIRQFEVYEYHAHAWSQIFISNVGWLTFDAVPPGEIISETTPAGIGKLRDPFGEEWRITPPEMTDTTLDFVRHSAQMDSLRKKTEELQRKVENILVRNEKEDEKLSPRSNIVKPVKKAEKADRSGSLTSLKRFLNSLQKNTFSALFRLKCYSPHLVGAITAAAVIFLLFSRRIFAAVRRHFIRRRLKKLFAEACHKRNISPEKSVLLLYRMTRLLLVLAGVKRRNNQELMDYAASSGKVLFANMQMKKSGISGKGRASEDISSCHAGELCSRLSSKFETVFAAFYAVEYGSCKFSAEETGKLFETLQKIAFILRQLEILSAADVDFLGNCDIFSNHNNVGAENNG